MLRLLEGSALCAVATLSLGLGACATTSSGGGTGGSGYNYGGSAGQARAGSVGSEQRRFCGPDQWRNRGSAGTGTGGSGGGAGSSGGGAGGASSGGTGGSSGQCSKPGSLHTNTIYCPFSATGGGKNLYCTPGTQHCCEGLTSGDVSTCEAAATACPANWTDWVCQKDADCGGGMQCCAAATVVKNTDQSCANYASKFHATKCEATCATGEVHMCTADADCGSGKTCLPFSTKGAQVGGCYPQ